MTGGGALSYGVRRQGQEGRRDFDEGSLRPNRTGVSLGFLGMLLVFQFRAGPVSVRNPSRDFDELAPLLSV